jgi:hypothetical protein
VIIPASQHSRWDFWTADGWLHRSSDGRMVPCEDAFNWYSDERSSCEWFDLGGES